MTKGLLIIVFLIFFFSCTKDFTSDSVELDVELKSLLSSASPSGDYEFYILPSGSDLSQIPQDVLNPLTPLKIELGKMLFFETALAMDAIYSSGIGTYSCSSCHIPEAGFRSGSPQGIADGGEGFGINGERRIRQRDYAESDLDVQSIRPLALINVAFVTNTFWNGQFGPKGVNIGTEDVWDLRTDTRINYSGYEALEAQNFIGIPSHRIAPGKALFDKYGYTALFDKVFEDVAVEDRYSIFTTSLAMSAYIRSIVSYEAPFQDWLNGSYDALTIQEKEGAILFFGKARCSGCHYEKNLGSMEFQALGVKDIYQRPSFNSDISDRRNLGRAGFTLKDEDIYKFRVPQLYNLSDSPFFFHGSSKQTLEDVIEYKITASSENANVPNEFLSEKFKPLSLSEDEISALLSFIKNGLRDPNLIRYKPENILSGNCYPNNDYQSKIDLGCD